MGKQKPLLQWTIREFLFVMTVGIVVLGSMWATKLVWQLAMLLAMLILIAMLVLAFTGRKEWRTFAIGFALAAAFYGVVSKINPTEIPTQWIWDQLRDPVSRRVFVLDGDTMVDSQTLSVTPDGLVRDKEGQPVGGLVGFGPNKDYFSGPDQSLNLPRIYFDYAPTTTTFQRTGETFWFLLLGYLGGKFAVGFRRYQDNMEATTMQNE
ncbi:hypothetical protein DTL42_06065 [Bremerella cremea]|uniref:Uncharacterized protein n=1 Tax=Bremerella cremea TaxID=1031537 RepID=A0A368KW86_9BACT|nr:hypothetical protein [Bremerella cremea]RCS54690.1 hypothetical protein DTL42_06065 [Bremerella cremea]